MKFPQNFIAGAGVLTARVGVLTAGAGGEVTGVCTALLSATKIPAQAGQFFS